MLFTAESLCPHVMKRNNLRVELMKASSARIVVSKSFATKTLLEQSGVDIINKIRCVVVSSAAKCLYKRKVFTLYPIFLSFFVLWGKKCQRGETESGVFSIRSHSGWDFDGSVYVTTHTGKIGTTPDLSQGCGVNSNQLFVVVLNQNVGRSWGRL